MLNKLTIPGTSITLEIAGENITVSNAINYDIRWSSKMQMQTPLWTQAVIYSSHCTGWMLKLYRRNR